MAETMEITVGIGEMKVASSPCLLRAMGIGSCVVVALYDKYTKIGGIAHIMLPDIEMAHDRFRPARFANVAIGMMIGEMKSKGAEIRRIEGRIFGGANMFPGIISSDSEMDIGKANIRMAKRELEKHGIEIIVEDVGDHVGRTVLFDTQDGSVTVKAVRAAGKASLD